MNRQTVRIRFRKAGDLRFLSHHDLMRLFERMLRRAELPVRSTEGFHPKPRIVFASALGLGIVGHQEVVDIQFDEPISEDEVLDRLKSHTPAGLDILSLESIPGRPGAQPRLAVYSVHLDPAEQPNLPETIADWLAQPEQWVQREKPKPRRVNIRPFVQNIRLEATQLNIEILVTPKGSARPEEVLNALGLQKLIAAGALVERTALELQEQPTWS